MALRYILQRRAVVVAIGVEADLSWLAEFNDLVENDPKPTAKWTGNLKRVILRRVQFRRCPRYRPALWKIAVAHSEVSNFEQTSQRVSAVLVITGDCAARRRFDFSRVCDLAFWRFAHASAHQQ
jgi:hypothetical protein